MKKPFLIDLDGVLRIGYKPADDIIPFLNYLQNEEIPACIISNSSIHDSAQIYNYFESNSLKINLPIITAIDAAYSYIEERYTKVAVFISENVIDVFKKFHEYDNPEAVLIGDIGDLWDYKLMQKIFEYVKNGAELIAAHKNKFWYKPDVGIVLDAGPFIHAIEYATDTKATLIGKPSNLYFKSALKKLNFDENKSFIMLGDDLESDMVGAKNLGAETILIFTGKTNPPLPKKYYNKIDYSANNLIEVIEIIKKL